MLNELALEIDNDHTEEIGILFDVKFLDSEVEAINTVGDMCNLLLRKLLSKEHNGKCASAMTFYTLRRALSDKRQGKKLSPSFDLSCMDKISAKELFKNLEQATGLKLPTCDPTRIGEISRLIVGYSFAVGILSFLAAFVVSRYVGILYGIAIWLWSVAVIWGGIKVGRIMDRYDPGRIPNGCQTLGGLAKQTALLNYVLLVRLGAMPREKEIWQILIGELSSWAEVPASEIAGETYFCGKSGKATTRQPN